VLFVAAGPVGGGCLDARARELRRLVSRAGGGGPGRRPRLARRRGGRLWGGKGAAVGRRAAASVLVGSAEPTQPRPGRDQDRA